MSARYEILSRIRTAVGPSPTVRPVPRDYHAGGQHAPGAAALLRLLTDRLEDYKATVRTCTPTDLAATLADLTRGWKVVIPAESDLTVPGAMRDQPPLSYADLSVPGAVRDQPPLSHADLDDVDAVVTGCAAACADTGTIALDGGPGQGRRALTLIPDRHVCVIYAQQVVQSVPELVRRLDPRRPLTFISGPSATSDIELDRVEGVHGPRSLIVVLVDPVGSAPGRG